MNTALSKAFSTQAIETTLDDLKVQGEIPKWLRGCFISTGPAQFEVGPYPFNHWLDGFAMLKKFEFHDGKVAFQNRFLQSEQYVNSNTLKALYRNEFSTKSQRFFLKKLYLTFKDILTSNGYDNCNVNITKFLDEFTALTETSIHVGFNLDDLNAIGHFKFSDNIRSQLSCAHPHFDFNTNETINVCIDIGIRSKYQICAVNHTSKSRRLIKSYVSDELFYMHSFSITENYVILFKSPLIIQKLKLLTGSPFNESLSFNTEHPSFFVIISRHTGETQEIEADTAFVCLHSINAFERNQEIVLDLICYEIENPYDYLYLKNLCSEHPVLPSTKTRRYTINLNSKKSNHCELSDSTLEFPRINYRSKNGKDYQYFYSNRLLNPNDKFFNAVEKFNVQSGSTQFWEKENYYPGEAIFVSKRNTPSEDEGVLLFIAFNASNQCSSLCILNAESMETLAEVPLPFHIPFGLHGNFYS